MLISSSGISGSAIDIVRSGNGRVVVVIGMGQESGGGSCVVEEVVVVVGEVVVYLEQG